MSYFQKTTTITISSNTDISTDTHIEALVIAIGNFATLTAVGKNDVVSVNVPIPMSAPEKDKPAIQKYSTVKTYSVYLITDKEILTEKIITDTISSLSEFAKIAFSVSIKVE